MKVEICVTPQNENLSPVTVTDNNTYNSDNNLINNNNNSTIINNDINNNNNNNNDNCNKEVSQQGPSSLQDEEKAQKKKDWEVKKRVLFGRIPVGLSEIIQGFLWLGSGKDARDKQQLKNLRITHIFNCASEWKSRTPQLFIYKRGNVLDTEDQDLTTFLEEGISFIEEARRTTPTSRVLVHCVVGKSRSAALTIAYLMRTESLSLKQAFEHVKLRRSLIMPNDGFMRQLMNFEMKLFGLSSSSMAWGEWKDSSKCALIPITPVEPATNINFTSYSSPNTQTTTIDQSFVGDVQQQQNSSNESDHKSTAAPKKVKPQPTPVQKEAVDAFVQTHVTPEFLQQGVQEVCGGSYDMQCLGQVLQWVNKSIRASTSSAEVLRMEGVSWNEISHFIDKSSKHWLRGHYGMAEERHLDQAIA